MRLLGFARFGLAALLVTGVLSCEDAAEYPAPEFATGAASFLELDRDVVSEEKLLVEDAVRYLERHRVDGRRVKWFGEVFGGDSEVHLLEFLRARVHFVLSGSTDVASRIRISEQLAQVSSERGATNLAALWFLKLQVFPQQLAFEFSGRPLEIPSTRVGIIQLGPALAKVPVLVQSGVLLHEARHSDCTGGVLASDVERLTSGGEPERLGCAHLHVLCPPGHDFEGYYACDGEAWGAYSVNFLYSAAMMLACTSCSSEERAVAEVAAMDAYSRLLVDGQAMLDGEFGVPDMTSSTEVLR